ncbi:MAG: carbohydrate ABC transporter permease [Oscillospiraceae bacterium]
MTDINTKAKRRRSLSRKKQKLIMIVTTVFAAVAALIFLMPTVLTFANSFMSTTEIAANYGPVFAADDNGGKTYISETVNLKFIPDMVSFSQYYTVLFKSPDYLMKFWNSVILVVPIVVFQLATAALAAYAFARLKGRLKEIIFFVYIIVMLMPYQVTLVPNYLVSDFLGILNTRWAIILPAVFTPFSVFLLSKIMRRIPVSFIEAAKLDGAGELQIFRYIALPLCKSVMYSVAILVFIDYWNMVEQPLVLLNDESLYPLSVFLSRINSGEIGLAFAVATIYMIPTLLMFLYGEDYLVEGISYSGGIKG